MSNYKGTWAIQFTSSFARSLQSKSSMHFSVFADDGYTNHEDFFFTSVHVNSLDIQDSQVAFFRLEALIKILNGILILNNQPEISYHKGSIYHVDFSNNRWIDHIIRRNTQLEYEELQNPFSVEVSKLTNFKSFPTRNDYVVDLFDLVYNEDLVKEVLIFLSLIKTDPLYLLVNVSKIVENIKFDLGLAKNKNEDGEKMKTHEKRSLKKTILHELSEVLGDNYSIFFSTYNFFTDSGKGSFSHFINTRDGSGIFARHGETGGHFQETNGDKIPMISFEEIEYNIRVLIYEWINYKLIKLKGYRYPPIERTSRVVALKDEDFHFDL